MQFVTKIDKQLALNLYNTGISSSAIAKQIGCHPNSIRKIINKSCGHRTLAEQNSIYNINRSFFSLIDDEVKAYWLGFIASDGYIRNQSRNSGHVDSRLVVKLSYKDIAHLEKLKVSLNSNHPIKIGKSNKNALIKDLHDICRLNINCAEIVRDLINLGINKFKSDGIWPLIPHDLNRHFVRGLIDGDGWFSVTKDRIAIGFCCPLKQPVEIVAQLLNIDNQITWSKGVWRFDKAGRDCVPILNYLYRDATIWLDRKYTLASRFLAN